MSEHPILMNAAMVLATLEGRKTQTRRPVTERDCWRNGLSKKHHVISLENAYPVNTKAYLRVPYRHKDDSEILWKDCGAYRVDPKWQPGDVLWVRETWQAFNKLSGSILTNYIPKVNYGGGFWVVYKADNVADPKCKWRPNIHMPKWACRLRLTVKRVWVERVKEISEADAEAEGMECDRTYLEDFEYVWNSIYGPDAWDRNDWVFCGEYEAVK